ncbi:hypothetical protein C4559_03975 [Candidatus Microgenomates bacterium]|nr:MAG: hypothetical protein C4559_03975 [Candidatus Microgenomates bacterium]
MKEINLISKRKEDFLKSKKVLKTLYTLSIACLFVTFICSVGIFLLKLSSPLPGLKAEEEELVNNISLAKQKLTKIVVLDERLKNVSGLLAKKSDIDSTIDIITAQAKDVKITVLDIQKKKLSISSSSQSLNSIDLFLNSLVAISSDKKKFSKVTLNNLNTDFKSGKYTFSLDIDLL